MPPSIRVLECHPWHRRLAVGLAAVLLVATVGTPIAGQRLEWNSRDARDLAERVVARRTSQISDSALAGYSAKARGTLEFLAQFGDTALLPPKIVRSSELAVDLYWTPPNVSRQVVVGLRDTSIVPMEIGFYRDRYGVVQSNFPNRIRLGDGNDVADIVHPFSVEGLFSYDFALADSFGIGASGERLVVREILFRPRDARQPLAVGSAYVSSSTADIVRLSFTFTRAAILDKRIESLSVVLENELVAGRFWLPRRQELEVERTGTVFDFPARGIVRGRWTICCYDLSPDRGTIARLMGGGGSGVVFRSAQELKAYVFHDSLFADMRSGSSALHVEDVAKVEAQARRMIADRMLMKPTRASMTARAISDLVRFDRAEGFAAGAGGTLPLRNGDFAFSVRGRYGIADERGKGEAALSVPLGHGRSLRLFAEREYRDASDVPETSAAVNSIAAQEFGSDRTDPFDVRGVGLELLVGRVAGLRWRLQTEAESQRALLVRAQPVDGRFQPLIGAEPLDGARLSLLADGGSWHPSQRSAFTLNGELRLGRFHSTSIYEQPTSFARSFLESSFEVSVGADRLVEQSFAALDLWRGRLPQQQLVYFGGPATGPGYDYHAFVGRAAASERVEWQHPLAIVPLPFGAAGRIPLITKAAAYLSTVWVDRQAGGSNAYPAAGAGAELFSGFVRLDVARGLRGPRARWTFSIDAGRAYWSVL